ncbi:MULTISPECIES: hypothetical protein [unclassified Pseudomonas]|uniref:hypothetical protein n=1 Tax=unclassified Pseudomonas TaxID=196821 RepID=UPI002109B425|nr:MULTISPECIES: hypothetical protein [unclassified Pseudomonas]
MANDLKLRVLLDAIDKASGPLKKISGGSTEAARALKTARDRLKELNSQQKDVSAWRAQRSAADETKQSLDAARERVKALSQQFAGTGVPTKAMTRDFRAAVREAQRLKQEHQQQGVQLQGLRTKLYDAGTLAKMKFANHAMYGEEEGSENERKFMDMLKVIELRGGLASKEAFINQADIVQRILTATGGRVGPNEWLNVIKTGGVAAKGIKDDAFYYQLEPLVQEMGGHRVGTAMMSAYSNVYQGKTTKRAANNMEKLGLVDPSKVKHDKAGQIAFLDVGAIKGSELFRENQFEWMEKVLLPQLAAKGIKDKNQVLDSIGSIFSNRTASNLFAQMYLQRDQIHKNARLNAGADGIDQLYDKGMNTAQGSELELLAQRANAYREMSQAILPTYVEALKSITEAIKNVPTRLLLTRNLPH